MPPQLQPEDDEDHIRSDDDLRCSTPDTTSTGSESIVINQTNSRLYIPYDLRIFHPNTLFTTLESLERERSGIPADAIDPSQKLRDALELEEWRCYWLCMRLRDAQRDCRELEKVNVELRDQIRGLQGDCEALREQINIVANETEAKVRPRRSSSVLRGVLRSRVINRVALAIRRPPSPLATSEIRARDDNVQSAD
jgi:hypothetical protein